MSDENVQAWFDEMRTLAAELPTMIPTGDVEITLVARGDFYGARCSLGFAATGGTAPEAALPPDCRLPTDSLGCLSFRRGR